jgi:hypothetical protein
MKIAFHRGIAVLWVAISVALLGVAGCRNDPRVDWEGRIGHFTFDQAVAELGPPDKVATLSDGRRVADWVEASRGGGFSFGVGTGFSTGAVGVGAGQSVGTAPRRSVLRLTFDAQDNLMAWSRDR